MVAYKKITIQDVAKAVGVSYATVSAVLSGNSGSTIRVGKATQEKINAKAKEMGYVPNQMARNLRQGNADLIAVFTYEHIFPANAKNEFYGFFVGIQEEAEKLGFDLLILNPRKNVASSRITQAAGALLIGLSHNDQDLQSLASRNYPLVFVGRRTIQGMKTHVVTFNYKAQIEAMMRETMTPQMKGFTYIMEKKSAEPSYDKERFLSSFAEDEGLKMQTIRVEDASLGAEITKCLSEKGCIILDRLSLIPIFNTWCDNLSLKKSDFAKCMVLEDDWKGCYGDYLRFSDCRKELGSLAVRHLATLIKGESTDALPQFITAGVITEGKRAKTT